MASADSQPQAQSPSPYRDDPEQNNAPVEEHPPQDASDPPSTMVPNAARPEGRRGDGGAGLLVWVAYIVFFAQTWFMILSNDPASWGWYPYHPLLMSTAIGCFIYSILTLQPTSQAHTKAAGLQRHQIATFYIGIPIMILATIAMALRKITNGYAHFTTWHGLMGIITVSWMVLQALMGGSTVWFKGAAWGSGLKARSMWKYHRLSGYILLPLFLLTAHLGGGQSDWAVSHSGLVIRLLAYTVAPIIMVVGMWSRIRTSKMKFF